MSDPNFVRWMLTDMRQNYPEAYAIWMRCQPEHWQLLTEKEAAGDEADSQRTGAPKKFQRKTKIMLITQDIPGSVLETNLPISAK